LDDLDYPDTSGELAENKDQASAMIDYDGLSRDNVPQNSHVFSRTSLPKLTRSLRESGNAGRVQGHLVEYIWSDPSGRFKT